MLPGKSSPGDWAEPDPRDRRYWTSPPYQSPFGGKGKGNTAGDGYGGEWVERPHYSNWTYRPNEGKDGKGQKGKNTASDHVDATGDPAADSSSAHNPPPPRQEVRGAHTDTAATDAPQPKPMPCMTRVVPTAEGSAILPAEALEDEDIDAEIEAAKQASLQQLPVNTILDTDSPTTVFSEAFAGFETMEQTEIDATLTALQDHGSDDIMAKVIQVVDEQVIPAKWAPPEQEQNTADLETSRKSVQVPVQNQQHVPRSPRSVDPASTELEPTSRLERVLDQVARPVALRDIPMNLQEASVGTTAVIEEFPTPAGGWVSIDLANVQRLRDTAQGNPPPPEIVQETLLTEPLPRMVPQGIQPDLASVFKNADEMVEAYQKGPRVFPTRPIQGPSLAPTTVSLTTPYS
eukprot:6492221-Amphidinium_carterae.1